MITPQDVVDHLATYLPQHTDLFSQLITVLSASSASAGGVTTITVNTDGAHGLVPGNPVTLSAGKVQNLISNAAIVDGNVQFTTQFDHDQTAPLLRNDNQTFTLGGFVGADSAWNGDNVNIGVPNRRNVIAAFPTGLSNAPILTGSEYLLERRYGLLGVHDIATTPDADTFTIDIDGTTWPTGEIIGLKVAGRTRVTSAVDGARAGKMYTKYEAQEAWAFVIMGDVDVSRDRHTFSDAIAGHTPQDYQRIDVLQNFSVVVMLNTSKDKSGSKADNLFYGEIFTALLKTLKGFQFADLDSHIPFVVVPAGHGLALYENSYIGQFYDWQLPAALTFENGFIPQEDVAFRDIGSDWSLFSDNAAKLALDINLDEEPLDA